MFTDVYAELPPHLIQQREELRAHLAEYGEYYPLSRFDNSKSS